MDDANDELLVVTVDDTASNRPAMEELRLVADTLVVVMLLASEALLLTIDDSVVSILAAKEEEVDVCVPYTLLM